MNYDNILILNKVGKVSVNYKSIAKYILIGFTILTFFRCLGLFYSINIKTLFGAIVTPSLLLELSLRPSLVIMFSLV